MDKQLFDRIVQQLLPDMDDPSARKSMIESALFGTAILNRIEWNGAAQPFTVRLVRLLHDFGEIVPGKPALINLLEEVRAQVGTDRQRQIHALIQELSPPLLATKGQNMTIDSGILIGFLLEVGRWAKSELGERWKLRREGQSADLTSRPQVEQTVNATLQTPASNPKRTQETVLLIERKRDAIDRARNAKLADREEFDGQRLAKAALEQREKDHNRLIRQMMDEIEADLNDLGFDVQREPA